MSTTHPNTQDHGPLPHWFGSKGSTTAYPRILNHLPPHSVYVEAFLGNGAILRHKPPALYSIGIDIDPMVIQAWRRYNWPGLRLLHRCAISWLTEHGDRLPTDALVYADPPYMHATRGMSKTYNFEMTDSEHDRLLDALDNLPCSVAISGYETDLYNHRLLHWRRHTWTVTTHGGARQETLWVRGTLASFGGRPNVTGSNYRQREKRKRKVNRWAANFAKFSPAEQHMILQALLDIHATNTSAQALKTS